MVLANFSALGIWANVLIIRKFKSATEIAHLSLDMRKNDP